MSNGECNLSDPTSFEVVDQALLALREGRAEQAAFLLEGEVARGSEQPHVHALLGIALGQVGRTAEAIARLEHAHFLKPSDHQILFNYGLALEAAGREDDAILRFLGAVRLKPDYARARQHLEAIRLARQPRVAPSQDPGATIPGEPGLGAPPLDASAVDPERTLIGVDRRTLRPDGPSSSESPQRTSPGLRECSDSETGFGRAVPSLGPTSVQAARMLEEDLARVEAGFERTSVDYQIHVALGLPDPAAEPPPMAAVTPTPALVPPDPRTLSAPFSARAVPMVAPEGPDGTPPRIRAPEPAAAPLEVRRRRRLPPPPRDSEFMPEPSLPGFKLMVHGVASLWTAGFVRWILPLMIANTVIALLMPEQYGWPLLTAFGWSIGFAVGLAPVLLALTEQVASDALYAERWLSVANRPVQLVTVTMPFIFLTVYLPCALTGPATRIPGDGLVASALIIVSPIHALLAPVLILAASEGRAGLRLYGEAFRLAGRRLLVQVAVMAAVSAVAVGVTAALLWGFHYVLRVSGYIPAQLMRASMLSVAESIWATAVVLCGLDAIAVARMNVRPRDRGLTDLGEQDAGECSAAPADVVRDSPDADGDFGGGDVSDVSETMQPPKEN